MKFLVLALCVCATSAASFGYKPWQPVQPVQPAQKVSQAFAQAVVSAPEAAYRAVEQPAVKAVSTPVAVAKSVAYTAPVAAAKTATVAGKEATAGILRSENDVAADGFNFGFETENGIAAQSSGALKTVDNSEVLAIQGSYQYVAPDGNLIQFSYVADENGYQPRSDILPVGPAIPDYIVRALEYIRAHPSKETN